jgi:hypothetical protein
MGALIHHTIDRVIIAIGLGEIRKALEVENAP